MCKCEYRYDNCRCEMSKCHNTLDRSCYDTWTRNTDLTIGVMSRVHGICLHVTTHTRVRVICTHVSKDITWVIWWHVREPYRCIDELMRVKRVILSLLGLRKSVPESACVWRVVVNREMCYLCGLCYDCCVIDHSSAILAEQRNVSS